MKQLFFLVICTGLLACTKDFNTDCDILTTAFIEENESVASPIIDNLCTDLEAKPTTQDPIGHEENMDILVDRLKKECSFDVILLSYATIETLPVQSEIQVKFSKDGEEFTRIVDIFNDPEDILKFSGIHQ